MLKGTSGQLCLDVQSCLQSSCQVPHKRAVSEVTVSCLNLCFDAINFNDIHFVHPQRQLLQWPCLETLDD